MHDLESAIRANPRVTELCRALCCIDDAELMMKFLRDLLSLSEYLRTANYWAAAAELNKGKVVRQVARELGLSPVTVQKARHWLYEGTGASVIVLGRLD